MFYEEGRFNPAGFVHLTCATGYLGTNRLVERLRHFEPELSGDDAAELQQALRDAPADGATNGR